MRQAFIKLHLAVLLAGMTGILGKLISLSAEMLVFYRMLIAGSVFFLFLQLTRKFVLISFKEFLCFFGIGILLALHWVFFYLSVKYSNVSVAVVSFSLGGFFTALFEPLVSKAKLQVSELAVSMLTVFGIGLIFHFDTQFRLGIIFGVLCAAFVAFFAIANTRAIRKYSPDIVLLYDLFGGALFLAIFLPFFFLLYPPLRVMPTLPDVGYLLVLSLACTIGLLLLENQAMKEISAFTVNLTFNLEPVYSIILAILFLGEAKELSGSFFLGLLCILVSVALQTGRMLRKKKQIEAFIGC